MISDGTLQMASTIELSDDIGDDEIETLEVKVGQNPKKEQWAFSNWTP